jgi:hypothetical protein
MVNLQLWDQPRFLVAAEVKAEALRQNPADLRVV